MFLELTERDTQATILVSVLHIADVHASQNGGCTITRHNATSRTIYVTETFDYIRSKLEASELLL